MTEHNILVTRVYAIADMGNSMKSDDGKGGRGDTRSTGVSLFRPGQPLIRPPARTEQPVRREFLAAPMLRPTNPDRVWESLTPVMLEPEVLAGNGLFPEAKQHSVTASFDILRTRLLHAMAERRWRRIAVTSPTHGCGKSLVAANLALSLARMPNCRTVLMDLELRNPGLAVALGVNAGPLRDFLTGEQPLESHFRRLGRNLALALNSDPVAGSAELLHDNATADALDAMAEQLDPNVVIFDLPPALGSDDVIAMLPRVDAVLLVADGTRTTAEDIRACERLLEGRAPLMGVVLNRAQDRKTERYRYGKK